MRDGSISPMDSPEADPESRSYPASCSKSKRHWSQHMYEVEVKITPAKIEQSKSVFYKPPETKEVEPNGNNTPLPQIENDPNMNSLFRGVAKRWYHGDIYQGAREAMECRNISWPVTGGAEMRQFCRYSSEKVEDLRFIATKKNRIHKNDVILEVNDVRVAGFTLYDLTDLFNTLYSNNVPILLKVVKAGFLPYKLREFMDRKYPTHTIDHELQQNIKENVYRRTLPCTTRSPRQGEVDGVQYRFIMVNEFFVLEQSGLLLESGLYEDNYYGTPFPDSRGSQYSHNSEFSIVNLLRTQDMGTPRPLSSYQPPWSRSCLHCDNITYNGLSCKVSPKPFTNQHSSDSDTSYEIPQSSQINSPTGNSNPPFLYNSCNSTLSSSSSSSSSSSVLATGLLSTLLSTLSLSSSASRSPVTPQLRHNEVRSPEIESRRKSITDYLSLSKKRKSSDSSVKY